MFRRFRHRLLLLLETGVVLAGALAIALQPTAWIGVLLCVGGSSIAALLVGRLARRYLQSTLGRLRRVADDVGHGRPVETLEVQRGDDLYKLHAAINLLANRLTEASEKEKRLHEELRRHERLAFLGELAASVAHEVNNPLDGVQNCARILRRSLDDRTRALQMLDLVDGGLARIELIVRRLLTLARQHVVRPTEAGVREIIDAALAAAEPKLQGRQIRVTRRYEVDDDRAKVDRPLLEQVFFNLATNAADSMPAGGELTVVVRREPAAGFRADPAGRLGASGLPGTSDDPPTEVLCVDVEDSGEGIPPEVVPHIFEPFFTTKPGGKGTGLGLAIAARIVDAHQGTIDVRPRDGGGTVFTVRLPASGTRARLEAARA